MNWDRIKDTAFLRLIFSHWAPLIACAVTVVSLTACNTTEGVGKDIESAGDGIKDAARDAKN